MSHLITPEQLEALGFIRADDRPFAWLLWLPDDQRPHIESYLQMIEPDHSGHPWTAELVNVVEGEWITAAVPKPFRTMGTVLFAITALGGRVLNPYLQEA